MSEKLRRFGLEPFVVLLFIMILLAWLCPKIGSGTDLFSLHTAAAYGISAIFFFYGLRMDWPEIWAGLTNWKLHLVVLFGTFVFFPLLILIFMKVFYRIPTPEDITVLIAEGLGSDQSVKTGLWLGTFFLAALPSTVSSSVVMVNIARGNVTGAIFNASLSSILGVFLTPLWMSIFITGETGGHDFSKVLFNLILQVLVPVLLGIFMHRWLGSFSKRHNSALKKFDQGVILLIVYTSFCQSFEEDMFSGLSTKSLLILCAAMAAIFFIVFGVISLICHFLCFNRGDRITASYCGSKKSLVHGTVMSKVLLGDPRLAGILILPTMIFHALQLIILSIIAQKEARQLENDLKEKVPNNTKIK